MLFAAAGEADYAAEACGLLCSPRAVDHGRFGPGVARFRRVVAEFCGAEEDVPLGQGCAVVAAAASGGAEGVVGSVEAGRDEDMAAQSADGDEPEVGDGVFEDVRAVFGPESSLVFGVMEGVDAVPPAVAMGEAVVPVVGEIEDGEVENEGNCSHRVEKWEKSGERERRDAVSEQ